jgi:hypothetical protein
MKVRYTPSHAGGTYDLDLTESQWQILKASPDYQLLSAEDIAKDQAAAVPPAGQSAAPAENAVGTVAYPG